MTDTTKVKDDETTGPQGGGTGNGTNGQIDGGTPPPAPTTNGQIDGGSVPVTTQGQIDGGKPKP